MSRPFSSCNRSIWTDIYLCHACSCQEIMRMLTPGQVSRSVLPSSGARALSSSRWRSRPRASAASAPLCTGAGGDNGIDHNKNGLRFPYVSTFLRSHYLHPHPYVCVCRCPVPSPDRRPLLTCLRHSLIGCGGGAGGISVFAAATAGRMARWLQARLIPDHKDAMEAQRQNNPAALAQLDDRVSNCKSG
eukprot:COSAG01_NODE_10434_length_2166_cov_8.532656_3_plen_189_part_00